MCVCVPVSFFRKLCVCMVMCVCARHVKKNLGDFNAQAAPQSARARLSVCVFTNNVGICACTYVFRKANM